MDYRHCRHPTHRPVRSPTTRHTYRTYYRHRHHSIGVRESTVLDHSRHRRYRPTPSGVRGPLYTPTMVTTTTIVRLTRTRVRRFFSRVCSHRPPLHPTKSPKLPYEPTTTVQNTLTIIPRVHVNSTDYPVDKV